MPAPRRYGPVLVALLVLLAGWAIVGAEEDPAPLAAGRPTAEEFDRLWLRVEQLEARIERWERTGRVDAPAVRPGSEPRPDPGADSGMSHPCGAPTKTTGAPCRRMVKGGGRCWQHR